MGRSVNYLNDAITVIYFDYGEIDTCFDCDDFVENLQSNIIRKLKSYTYCDRWDNNETKIILENNLCIIGISEYGSIWSLSVVPNYGDWFDCENLAIHHAGQIENTLIKILDDLGYTVLSRLGTMSNGCNVYEKMLIDNI